MSPSRLLLVASALFLGLSAASADDAKPDAQKARQMARQKAKAEAAAKAKADAEARAKAEAEEKAKQDAAAKVEAEAAAKRRAEAKKSLDPTPLVKRIDVEINKKLATEKVPASPRADDAEFLRRVTLDLTGVIPPADKVVAFLDSKDAQKRAKLIEDLLASPGFGRHLADMWDNLLFQRVSENRAILREPLTRWLEEKFNADTPWDLIVGDLLTASGTQEENGAATFFLSALSADKMVDTTSRALMGIKMECAQCHNHPFTGWKQNDYWGMAAFFTRVRFQGNPKNARGATPTVNESGQGRQRLPESAKMLPPKFFQGDSPTVTKSDPLRPLFAKWLTNPENKYFARAFANRVWGQLFGAGIVNPIDDMHEERVASHPELLAELAKYFTLSEFDVKFLYRAICNSEAYQRTSKPVAGNESDRALFSHMNVKSFTPEQLYDSLIAVLGDPAAAKANAAKSQAAGAPPRRPPSARDQFVAFFDPGDGARAIDYDEGIPQALRLMNGPQTGKAAANVARNLTKGHAKDKAIEALYLATISRRPTAAETGRLTKYIDQTTPADSGFADILWALLNSSEFTLNH